MILVGLVSGGMDSATAFADAIETFKPNKRVALTVVYGQRHKREVEAAKAIAKYYGAEHVVVDVSNVFNVGKEVSALLGANLPKAEELKPGLVPRTYVPQRNMVLLSVAGVVLESFMLKSGELKGVISVGFHRTDYAPGEPVYPDTRPEFVRSVETSLNLGSAIIFNAQREGKEAWIKIYAPFAKLRKADVVRRAVQLGVPLEKTWSCYKGGERPCGECPACVTRLRAFTEAGVPDPLTPYYEKLPEWYERWLKERR